MAVTEAGKYVLNEGITEAGEFVTDFVDECGKITWPISTTITGGPIGKVVKLYTILHSRVRRR
jgi:hypothetical protein